MAKLDPAVIAHLEWIGFVQPTGLVVSAPALARAGAVLNRADIEGQQLLRSVAWRPGEEEKEDAVPHIDDFEAFARTVLGWSFSPKGYAGVPESPIPPELELPIEGEVLRPDFAVRELDPEGEAPPWQLLVRISDDGDDFDRPVSRGGALEISDHSGMERLLRQTRVPAGLLFNGKVIRLLSAPYGESSGWLDFRVADMVKTAGRSIATAMRLLLGQQRLLSLPRQQRLASLLEDSRKFQNEVSARLAEQVLHALYELLRGFQHANDQTKGDLLRYTLADHPDQVYRGLLTVLLRMIFLLYAEERDMLPEDETFLQNYSIIGLYKRLREDQALHPDTMDGRYGAWAQLLALFRMIHDGADAGAMRLPKRHGVLFDPDSYPFLEGRFGGSRQIHERIDAPLVPDGTIWRVLEDLLVLDGERISYRALDVEQIGSVYETMMGFRLERATGLSVAIKAQKKQGAPTAINLEALLEQSPSKRDKWISDRADRKLTPKVKAAVKEASAINELHDALSPVVDRNASPDIVPAGGMVLQPSEERRRSGSHYTPRELTEPIVRTTLEPILKRLRGDDDRTPRPEQILDLKVCDPAMGSGAFLVEACRQLAEALVESRRVHDAMPKIPSDEDEVIFARRLVAQRCLYGVDRNPVAVDLAKVSLWLITLAKEHPLTFVDHALRHGDSLVGLSRRQIEVFHWDESAPEIQKGFEAKQIREHLRKVGELRGQIREAGDEVPDRERRALWEEAKRELEYVRLFGDLVVNAWFEGSKAKEREDKRLEYAHAVLQGNAGDYREEIEKRRHAEPPVAPFHWQIEFPEVFERDNGGFNAIVGNPPFAGKNSISLGQVDGYLDWLKEIHRNSHGNADVVAHFFRRAFTQLCSGGALGLIATNTIAQGDTRRSGLLQIRRARGHIYCATRRIKWPGQAAVVVSVVHVMKGVVETRVILDGRQVEKITAFLVPAGEDEDPVPLTATKGMAAQGPIFPQHQQISTDESTLPLELIDVVESNHLPLRARIRDYIGGDEFLNDPQFSPSRWVVDLDGFSREDAAKRASILFEAVKEAFRASGGGRGKSAASRKRAEQFWLPSSPAREARRIIDEQSRFLMHPFTATYLSFGFVPRGTIVGGPHNVIAIETFSGFASLQSRVHERWARFFGSSLKDDQRYTPTDCLFPFPFPENWESHAALEAAGKEYYEFRAELMVKNDEGLTKTCSRFHDPEEQSAEIEKLRELHAAMDRAVLDAYGWTDVPTDCEFILDYEIDEEEWNPRNKKPWRYRWPDEIHDEVLARLLELNADRAREEARAGRTGGGVKKERKGKRRSAEGTKELF